MGGLVGSLYDLFSGDPAKAQENQLSSLGGYGMGVGEGLITPAAKYEESILSGDPTLTAQAMAPEISASQNQTQQFKNQMGEFSPRSGGTASAVAGADLSGRGTLIDLLGQERSGAAGTSLSAGSGLLGQAGGNISDVANLRTARQQQSANDWNQIGQAAAEMATMGMSGGMGGADPYQTLYNAQHPDTSAISTESPDLGSAGFI